MLLEQVVEKAGRAPEYDWEGYYNWYFSELSGREVNGFAFWNCQKCHTINVLCLPSSYGKCRSCCLIHLP